MACCAHFVNLVALPENKQTTAAMKKGGGNQENLTQHS